ncbi:hypothetical protein HUG10_08290 [Halorarum halophilum]|uniref:Uncharacterized protein n=1 Tax=Halorarum halophilum TaxID=2743090 RepID=A0A7D5GF98_9EURY|nr:hypothetical protein [Halobaculum halophilum]QLG27550.1 hypothetical protein HUG10_08290 [Halobaculum halophilum]
MAAEAALLLLFLVFAIGAPLVLYAFVRDERKRDATNVTDRSSAERAARKDLDGRSADGGEQGANRNDRP